MTTIPVRFTSFDRSGATSRQLNCRRASEGAVRVRVRVGVLVCIEIAVDKEVELDVKLGDSMDVATVDVDEIVVINGAVTVFEIGVFTDLVAISLSAWHPTIRRGNTNKAL